MNEDRDIFLAANLGSEVTRLLRAKEERDAERARGAYERACAIVEELKMNTNASGQSESAMLLTVLDDFMRHNPVLSVRAETLKAYFYPFARKVLGV